MNFIYIKHDDLKGSYLKVYLRSFKFSCWFSQP